MRRILIMLALCCCAAAASAQANYMNYQGKLINADGTSLEAGVKRVFVNIYDAPTTGNLVWGPFSFDNGSGNGHGDSVNVAEGGRFNVILGPKDGAGRDLISAFPAGLAAQRYIEIQVENDPPILPRQQLLSVPYAFQALSIPGLVNAANGNVGIGIDTPTAKLDVGGNVKIAGDITVSGKGTFSGGVSIGARNLTVSSGILNVDGAVKINGDLEATGGFKNFATNLGQSATAGDWSTNNEFGSTVVNTNLPATNWFCALSRVTSYDSFSGGFNQTTNLNTYNSSEVVITNGVWVLKSNANNTGGNIAAINCFKFK